MPADSLGNLPTEPGVLRPSDKDLLAAAIREGMAPDPPSWSGIVKSIVFVVVVGIALMVGYQALQRWRPAVPLRLDADQTTTSQQITFGAGTGTVRWKVLSGDAVSLQVTGPASAAVEVDVPLPASSCTQVATELGPSARCLAPTSGGAPAVEFASPLSLDWASPNFVELIPPPNSDTYQSSALGVTVTGPGAALSMPAPTSATSVPAIPATQASTQPAAMANGSAITVVADTGRNPQRWCFVSPSSANSLRLQRGANQSVHAFLGSEADVPCGTGLRLIVGSGNQTPAVTVQGVVSLRLDVTATQQDAQSVVGQLHMGPSGAPVLGTPTELVVSARPSKPIHTTLFQRAGRSTLSVSSAAATSVLTDNGNLVTSVWDRYQDLALPILLTIVGGLAPILLATMQGLMSVHRMRHRQTQPH